MKTVIDWKTGEPEKDGMYYIRLIYYMMDRKTCTLTKYVHIKTLEFTVRYGWNTSYAFDGSLIAAPDYSPEKNEKRWADITHWAEIEVLE